MNVQQSELPVSSKISYSQRIYNQIDAVWGQQEKHEMSAKG